MQIQIDVAELWQEVARLDPRLADLAIERVKNRKLEERLAMLTSEPSSEDGNEHQ